jgi:hypothetical protein
VQADPLGARWFDGEAERSIRDLVGAPIARDEPVLTAGCLVEPEAIDTLDDRGAAMLPALAPYLRT